MPIPSRLSSFSKCLASLLLWAPLTFAQSYVFNRADFPAGTGAVAVGMGDLNDDGKVDVVVANSGAKGGISVLLANIDAKFALPTSYSIPGGATSIAVGDLNGDGKLDVLTVSNTNQISVFQGAGNGTLQPLATFAAGQTPSSLALGDLNSDGKLDLVLSDSGSGVDGVEALLGNGDGTFQPATVFATAHDPRMAVLGDFNKDTGGAN